MNQLETVLMAAQENPATVEFAEVMAVIDAYYHYQPSAFSNSGIQNDAGSNEGSCKIFALAKLHGLSQSATLALFGRYYREDVLEHPNAVDHANIRTFIKHGWAGITFAHEPLSEK
ncbi:type III effector [Chromatiales bacterium (ex Bugula neritina AB1)]|nr:type III effector [Chromatiales bacterium (ex Bugula neritina AB1)]